MYLDIFFKVFHNLEDFNLCNISVCAHRYKALFTHEKSEKQ